jgi:hypothetical protein
MILTRDMRQHERKFEIASVVPFRGFCTFCYKKFEAEPRPHERSDDLILWMRAEFDRHDCKQSDPLDTPKSSNYCRRART